MLLSKCSEIEKVLTPDVGSKPHQPLTNFKFLYREFGKQKKVKRAFQHSRFSKWKWLHYEEDTDKAFCYNCIKFKEHESSNRHKDSVVVTVDPPSSAETLQSELTKQKMETDKCCSKSYQVYVSWCVSQ